MRITPDLTTFPLVCIYALVDTSSNSLFPLFSNGNSLNQLSLHLTQLRRGIHDCKKLQDAFNRNALELRVLKAYEVNQVDLVLRVQASLLFNNSGYTDMTGHYSDIRYRIVTRVDGDYRDLLAHIPLVYVTLKSRSLEALVIGVFDSMMDADEWLGIHYPGQKITSLVFATNERTVEYHNTAGYKLIRDREKL